ncbi:MAG: type II toxin-antitoxin system RelE/ParE family toxin [Lachnospiraceae bacterium]|nr:type II toxin-antitoxin system RelE/ParE family toxin [Lachnospiraceae bacterium]
MKKYIVQITGEALSDMEQIYNYVAFNLLAPQNAAGQYDRIADAILTLDELADRIKVMDSEPEHSQGMRQLLVDNYSIFYVIEGNKVIVTNILYSASDIQNRLR